MKLATDFNEQFKNDNSPYISRDAENNTKIYNELNFEDFILNLDTTSIINKDTNKIEINVNNMIYITLDKSYKCNTIIFRNCKFANLEICVLTHKVIFDNCTIDNLEIIKKNYNKVSETIHINGGTIDKLTIDNSTIKNKFYINKQSDTNNQALTIDKLIIKDTIFKENFKLHRCTVNDFILEDVDFEKNADFFMSVFTQKLANNDKKNIYFKAINFKGLALFGDTKFKEKLIFKYVTFEGHNHFKSAELHKGLDLEYTNIQKEINFYGIDILDTRKTSQETYRIIKHQFNKLGNIIEANKYHALELEQKRINLSNIKFKSLQNLSEWMVFSFHKVFSNHSSSWYIALFWIFVIGGLTYLSIDNFVCLRHNCTSNWIDYFKYISIINLDNCIKENPLIFVLNKISLGYLYYQFLLSVRKDTRK